MNTIKDIQHFLDQVATSNRCAIGTSCSADFNLYHTTPLGNQLHIDATIKCTMINDHVPRSYTIDVYLRCESVNLADFTTMRSDAVRPAFRRLLLILQTQLDIFINLFDDPNADVFSL